MSQTSIMYEGFALIMDKSFDKNEYENFHQAVIEWFEQGNVEGVSSFNVEDAGEILKAYRKYVRFNYPDLDISPFFGEEGDLDGYVIFAVGAHRITTSDVFVRASPKEREQIENFRKKFIPKNTAGFFQWRNEGTVKNTA